MGFKSYLKENIQITWSLPTEAKRRLFFPLSTELYVMQVTAERWLSCVGHPKLGYCNGDSRRREARSCTPVHTLTTVLTLRLESV